jgi:cardiolipin synthase C
VLADQPAERDPATDRPDQLAAALVEFLDGAQQEILIASAYLVPTAELESALQRAEARGVQVRILTNSLRSNNHTAAHSAYRNYVGKLLGHGVDMHETRALAKDRSRYMLSPIDHKHLGLHAKVLVIDKELSFIGSANLDPRSLQTNTEMGLMIRSPELNRRLRDALALDFDRRNAWHLQFAADGSIIWVGDDQTLEQQPAESTMQRIEDWFFSNLPIGNMM